MGPSSIIVYILKFNEREVLTIIQPRKSAKRRWNTDIHPSTFRNSIKIRHYPRKNFRDETKRSQQFLHQENTQKTKGKKANMEHFNPPSQCSSATKPIYRTLLTPPYRVLQTNLYSFLQQPHREPRGKKGRERTCTKPAARSITHC